MVILNPGFALERLGAFEKAMLRCLPRVWVLDPPISIFYGFPGDSNGQPWFISTKVYVIRNEGGKLMQ